MRVYLANVGANAAHRVRSPLFPDGTFEFVTIPETAGPTAGPMRRYRDLLCFNDLEQPLTRFLPPSAADTYTHADPEFETRTYGDNCGRSPRAAGLMRMQVGDCLFFLARLTPWCDGRFTGPPGFYFTGFLEIDQIVKNVRSRPDAVTLDRIEGNAHVRRGLADPAGWDGFWVFCGSPRSRRFRLAVPVTRAFAEATLTDARGAPWVWDRGELQVIGSYTRSCRCVLSDENDSDGQRRAVWWDHIRRFNPDLPAL